METKAIICKCKNCNLIFENPITLPCGNTLCHSHLNDFNQKFICCFCHKEHLIPEDDFCVNKSILNIIDNLSNGHFIEL